MPLWQREEIQVLLWEAKVSEFDFHKVATVAADTTLIDKPGEIGFSVAVRYDDAEDNHELSSVVVFTACADSRSLQYVLDRHEAILLASAIMSAAHTCEKEIARRIRDEEGD